MPRFISLWFYLSVFAALVSGKPSQYINNTTGDEYHLAIDSENEKLIHFSRSGRKLGTFFTQENTVTTLVRRESPWNCTELTIDDVYKLPGWSKLEATAKTNWGSGSYELALNPEQYKDAPAMLCVPSDIAMVNLLGEPNCQTRAQSRSGKPVGSDGKVKIEYQRGSHLTQHTRVTQGSSIGVGMEISPEVGFPGIAGVTTQLSTLMATTNNAAQETDSTADTMQTQSVEQDAPANNTCHLDVD